MTLTIIYDILFEDFGVITVVRLQKAIADLGYCSRRKAEELITEGRVKVNGIVVTELGTKVSDKDRIEVNNVIIEKELIKMIFKIIDWMTGEQIEATTKVAMYEELFNRMEDYGTSAYTHREITEDLEDYIIHIERA